MVGLCVLVTGLLLLIPAILILWFESTQLPDLEEEMYTSIEGCNCFLLQCYKYPEKCSLKKRRET